MFLIPFSTYISKVVDMITERQTKKKTSLHFALPFCNSGRQGKKLISDPDYYEPDSDKQWKIDE